MPASDLFTRRRSAARAVRNRRAQVEAVRVRERRLQEATPRELADRADELREISLQSRRSGLDDGQTADAFALVSETVRRTLGLTYYDVQLQAGRALTDGSIAEMQTGEGKTISALLPAFVHSLNGRGVHVATSNAYLAERDCDQLRPVFELLNTTVGLVSREQTAEQKRTAYGCDIVYAPGYEPGFDYLRDQVTLRRAPERPLGEEFLARLRGNDSGQARTMQRRLAATVIDEADNVLIDDACSPLLLSEQSDQPATDAAVHLAARDIANELVEGQDFTFDRHDEAFRLSESGHERIWSVEDSLPLKELTRPWNGYIDQALRARHLFRRDVHYVVRDEKVVIVDETTGRLFEERSWRDGLHQAIEAAEGLTMTSEKRASARITRQRFFRLYERTCGMTGTASGSEREFGEIYSLPVVSIPTHRPCLRELLPTRFFTSFEAKWDAITADVQEQYSAGRPVLIGTRSINRSRELAAKLEDHGIPFQLLNGLQDADEAAIVARAGVAGTVTIATNMAGRGTDIQPDEKALSCGGLHVIAAEHHDSNRIDRQLMGRAARQGNPGSARFFVSSEDELIVRFGPRLIDAMEKSAQRNGELRNDLSHRIRRIQKQVERIGYLQRRQLFQQEQHRDSMLNRLAGKQNTNQQRATDRDRVPV